jgi:hypothetical protein
MPFLISIVTPYLPVNKTVFLVFYLSMLQWLYGGEVDFEYNLKRAELFTYPKKLYNRY